MSKALWKESLKDLAFNHLENRAEAMMLGCSPDFKVRWINQASREFFRFAPDAGEEVDLSELLEMEFPEDFVERFCTDLKRGKAFKRTLRHQGPRGMSWYFRVKAEPLEPELEKGRSHWLISFDNDREAARMESELSLEAERINGVLRAMEEGVILVDAAGRVARLNQYAEQLTGWRESQALGVPSAEVFSLVDPASDDCEHDPLEHVLKTGLATGESSQMRLVTKSGQHKQLRFRAAPIFGPRSEVVGAVTVFEDVSHRTIVENELIKAQRLETVSLLAGGIAHDFNNILTGILGNISLARQSSGSGKKLDSVLKSAEKAANRARALTQQLLSFSQGSTPITTRVAVDDLLEESVRFILSGSRCTYSIDAANDLWVVEVDENQISQVFQNLLINAVQAMPEGGEIRAQVHNRILSADEPIPLPPGDYVEIIVKDQGQGISDEHLPRIFDPYFTTKEKGTGLGLATAFAITRRHEGCLNVESKPGEGATFRILLPAIREARRPDREEEPRLAQGGGHILIMDDEEMVQQIAADMLAHLGYSSDRAFHGQQALDKYLAAKDSEQPFDAVMVDLTVPGGLGGLETLKLLRKSDPDAIVVVCSGYSNDPITQRSEQYGFNGKVLKPYNLQQLSRSMKEALAC